MGTTRRWCLLLGLVLALSLSSACEDSAGVAILDQSDGSEELDTTEEQTELSDLEELEDVDGTEQTEPDTDLIEDVELEEDNDFPDFDVPDEEEQLQPCSRDADCEEGQLCRFIIENGELSLGCAWPLGPRAPGEACSADDQCAHGACIGNICARPCLSDNDCAVGYVCESRPFASTTVDICVPEPVVCAANADCAEAQLCVVDRSGSELLLLCGEAVGPGTLGTSCSSDAECEANLCVAGQCTAPCERHADCADDGSWQCEELELEHGGGSSLLEVCQPTPATVCLSDGMCLLPERCVASKQNSSVSWTCQAPVGPAEAGESCAFDAACVSNLCANGRCMAPCAASADCPSDYTCNKLSVDVPAGRTEVSVCIPPVYCQDNAVCLTSEVCYAQRKPDDISLTCHTPNVGGDLGVGCNTDGQCRMNLCIPGRFGDYCSRACDQNADCGAGFHCGSEELETLSGSTVTLSLCQRDNAVPCQSRSDCGTGTVCAIVPNVANTALESVCVPVSSGSSTGVPCSSDATCASRVCLNDYCAAPCVNTDQCASTQLCLPQSIERSGLSGSFQLCTNPPDELCLSSADCSDGVRVCSDLRVGTSIELYCLIPNDGGLPTGSACSDSSECYSSLCLSVADECTMGCETNAQCGAGFECTAYRYNPGPTDLGVCARPCLDNQDCRVPGANSSNVCSINSNFRDNSIDLLCETQVGTGDVGAPCPGQNGSLCQTGLCLRTYAYDGTVCTNDTQCASPKTCQLLLDGSGQRQCATTEDACTAICDDVTDCTGSTFSGNALTSCSPNTTVGLPAGGGSTQISTCARP